MNKINKVLWPSYFYLLILVIYYKGRGIDTPLLLSEIIILFSPIFLLGYTLFLTRKTYRNLTRLIVFSLCLIPGALFGLQLANGLTALSERDASIQDWPGFLFVTIFFAIASGFLGLLINFVINITASPKT